MYYNNIFNNLLNLKKSIIYLFKIFNINKIFYNKNLLINYIEKIYFNFKNTNLLKSFKITYILIIVFFIYLIFLNKVFFFILLYNSFNYINLLYSLLNFNFHQNLLDYFLFDIFKINYIKIEPIFLLFNIFFFLSTIFSLFSINFLGFYGVFILNLISLFLFWLSLIYCFYLIFFKNIYFFISMFNWINLYIDYKISLDLIYDSTSLSFLFLTITIGLFVYIYSFSYFRYEPSVDRLLIYLNLFMLSMNFLVTSSNFISLILGWELIGLTSFFLINFWINRVGTFKAAFKAYSFNKLSDFFLLLAVIFIFNTSYSLDIFIFNNTIHLYEVFYINIFNINIKYLDIISFLFIGCIFIKSAQIIGHLWLPDSMEAPVPASALIHSATLVSAGIFLLIRLSPLFELSYYSSIILPISGALTALYGSIVASFQSDTKKTLAYSTISHCGYLVLLYTTNLVEFVILYLYVHGFFKAATFLCVGNVNRFSKNNQDFKLMGYYYKFLPFECFTIFICLLNLSSIPLTLGFYIKHLLFLSFKNDFIVFYILFSITLLSGVMSIFYSFRLFYSIFFDIKKSKKNNYISIIKSNLNSLYYSNTSLISNISILLLLIFSYIIILILYNLVISDIYYFSDIQLFKLSSLFLYNVININTYLFNVSILNWFIILLINTLIFLNWRYSYYSIYSKNTLIKLLLLVLLFINII
uniref:NADH dehydrogenase subunit 5 n=1 Tax=Ichthyophthirius multifiliis TaxID=5932 RepID=G1FLD7_ICHMU|nr:NADH dehydrogenase subunit 5 [Ichthyophthirius multifiliis]AEL89279.1 NADH dehydrogenase subunit 5 [Ichthyophthirius multifiliis]